MNMKLYTKIINEETKECLILNQEDAKRKAKELELQEMEVEFGYDGKAYLKGYAPERPMEEQLLEAKELKKQELKQARDNYLISKGYNLSENDKFNIINLIDGYTEEDRNNYLIFLNNDLIPKYNHYSKLIDDGVNVEEVEGIEIEFIPPTTSETEENDDEEEKDINNNN